MNLKRMFRDFKSNLTKHISFVLLIALSVSIIVGFNRSMDSYLDGIYAVRENCNMEDGCFCVYEPISSTKIRKLENKYQMTIEKCENVDIDLTPTNSDFNIHLRIFSIERKINQPALIEGKLPSDTYEICLDSKFAKAHHYPIGSTISLSHISYKVVGYAISPDYIYTLEETSDTMNNPDYFGVAYTTLLGFNEIKETHPNITTYSYLDPYDHHESLKHYLSEHSSLVSFTTAKDNSRIATIINDVKGPKNIALIMGLLLMVIIAFIISISIKNTISSESQTIGILYSQGLNKSELLRYYLMLPCLLVTLGICIGYPIGIMISKPLLVMVDVQYTMPPIVFKDTTFIFFAGVFLPLFISMAITYSTLSSALSKTPLSLLRGQHSTSKVTPLEERVKFNHLSFFNRFRLKNIIREKGSMLSLMLGVLLSMFILLTGLFFRDSISHYIENIASDFPYEYLYRFKSQSDLDKYSKQGEQLVLDNFTIDIKEKTKNIVLYGIQTNSQFFDMPQIGSLKNNEVLMAPCLTNKLGIRIGDTITLTNSIEDTHYEVKIIGYAPYDFGQYLYTSIAGYNQITDQHKYPYNTLLTRTPLDIDSDKITNLTTKANIITSTNNLLGMISVFTTIMVLAGMAILIIVIYLLMNMILEKGSINISMVKIFGYSQKEINKLYLKGTVLLLILCFFPAIPASYSLCKAFYDSIFAEMDKYFLPYINPTSLLAAFILMVVGYNGACFLLKRKINQIALTEALKNRE